MSGRRSIYVDRIQCKAKEVLGWNPQYADLETIIGTAWKWHKKSSKWILECVNGGGFMINSISMNL